MLSKPGIFHHHWLLLVRLLLLASLQSTIGISLRASTFTATNVQTLASVRVALQIVSSSTSSSKSMLFMMGKGDNGKKKRKKSKNTPSPPTTTATTAPSPPLPQRVTSNSIIPVRHQLVFARMRKAAAKQLSMGSFRQPKVVRTSYKRTWTEEEMELKKEERARKGQEPDWAVILNQTSSRPLVIVDGYNIIHKWPRLTKHMRTGDTGRARRLLVEDLESLTTIKGWRIEVVFDGAGKSIHGVFGKGPGTTRVTASDRAASKDVSKYGVRVVFTGVGIEADSYIEARCAEAKAVTDGAITRSFIVATDDSMIRMAGMAAGALCMSASRFVDELKAVKKATEYRVELAVAKANGHAVRPESLRGKAMPSFGRGSVLIEDKRNKTKSIYTTFRGSTMIEDGKRKEEEEFDTNSIIQNIIVETDERGIPLWAVVPNHTKVL